jgi:uncharacterized membrane protein
LRLVAHRYHRLLLLSSMAFSLSELLTQILDTATQRLNFLP